MTLASFLTFRLGAEQFAIDVARVREVLDLSEITRVPAAPLYLRGVVDVRGAAVPVVDLRLKFGLPAIPDSPRSRIVVFELGAGDDLVVLGGLADSVHDVIELDRSTLAEPPRIASRWRAELIQGIAKVDDRFVLVLDIVRVFETDDLLHTSAALPEPTSVSS